MTEVKRDPNEPNTTDFLRRLIPLEQPGEGGKYTHCPPAYDRDPAEVKRLVDELSEKLAEATATAPKVASDTGGEGEANDRFARLEAQHAAMQDAEVRQIESQLRTLPDIEKEGEAIARDTWRHPSGMYSWADLVGAIQIGIAEERVRHVGPAGASNDRYANDAAAKALYDTWSYRPGWVPWVERGNSEMQERARREVAL